MRLQRGIAVLALWGMGGGVVNGHVHAHGDEGVDEVPLHERPFVKDSVEELERKWSFEVGLFFFFVGFACFFFGGLRYGGVRVRVR